MSDSGICRTDYSSTRTSLKLYHWNHQSAACGDVIRVICGRGRSRPASSRRDQSARGRARSASVVSQAHLGGGTIVQLPCTGHPTPADYGTGPDTGLQSYPLQDRLLQCCAARRSKLQHQEVTVSTEQRSWDRSRSTKTIPR